MARHKKTIDEKERQPFATRIRTLIDADPQITQADVAAAIGKSRQVVSQYCHGDSEPAYDTLVKIAAFFGVTVDYLLGVTETKSTRPDLQAAVQLSGISEENMAFLESCVQLSAADPESLDPVAVGLSLASLHCVNNLVEIVGNDPQLVADFISMTPTCKHGRERGAGPACAPAAGTVYQNNMEVITHSDFVRFKAREVGRAIEQHLLEMYHYGND